MWFTSFLQSTSRQVVSGDTMMHKDWGPVWHAKHKAQGIMPARLRGVDQDATWGKSHSDGRGYGHGSCCLVSHHPCVLGAFTYRRHSAHDATRLWLETGHLGGIIETVIMDGKADDQALLAAFQRQRWMPLLTPPRQNSDHTEARQRMLNILNRPNHRRLRQPRGQTVEPMPGVVQDIFALERCWMRGHRHHRWRLAALGVTVQWHQASALKRQCAGWKST
jgi:hypothetical protein